MEGGKPLQQRLHGRSIRILNADAISIEAYLNFADVSLFCKNPDGCRPRLQKGDEQILLCNELVRDLAQEQNDPCTTGRITRYLRGKAW